MMKNRYIYTAILIAVLTLVTAFAGGCTKKTENDRQTTAEIITENAAAYEEDTGVSAPQEISEDTSAELSEETVAELSEETADENSEDIDKYGSDISEDGIYDTKDEVCAYLLKYHRLPDNYMTKSEAREKGWSGGALSKTIPGKCIGGDRFGNNEELLPEEKTYHECDIDTLGKASRGAKRIVYSDDFDIYYTDDHYESFTKIGGEEVE